MGPPVCCLSLFWFALTSGNLTKQRVYKLYLGGINYTIRSFDIIKKFKTHFQGNIMTENLYDLMYRKK